MVINQVYTCFRAVTVASVQEEVVNLGSSRSPVEIGLVSLGTTSADGTKREVTY